MTCHYYPEKGLNRLKIENISPVWKLKKKIPGNPCTARYQGGPVFVVKLLSLVLEAVKNSHDYKETYRIMKIIDLKHIFWEGKQVVLLKIYGHVES